MWERLKEWIKEHPYLAGVIGVLAVVLIYFLFFRGSSTGTTASTDNGLSAYYDAEAQATQAADALQAYQYQANAQAGQTAAQLQAVTTNDATQIQLAQIASGSQDYQNTLAAQVASLNITNNATTTQQANTLSAQVQNNTTAANENLALTQLQDQTTVANNQIAYQTQLNNNETSLLQAQQADEATQVFNAQILQNQSNVLLYAIASGEDTSHSSVSLASPPG